MTRVVAGILLILAGLFWIADMLLGLDLGWRWLPGVVLMIIGMWLVTRGDEETSYGPAIAGGLVVLVIGMATPGGDLVWSSSGTWKIGSAAITPSSLSDNDEFAHWTGEYIVDLTDTDVAGRDSSITVSNGVGNLTITPPCDQSSVITASSGFGTIRDEASGDEEGPLRPSMQITAERRGRATLDIKVTTNVGDIVIREADCPYSIPGLGSFDPKILEDFDLNDLRGIDEKDIARGLGTLLGRYVENALDSDTGNDDIGALLEDVTADDIQRLLDDTFDSEGDADAGTGEPGATGDATTDDSTIGGTA